MYVVVVQGPMVSCRIEDAGQRLEEVQVKGETRNDGKAVCY